MREAYDPTKGAALGVKLYTGSRFGECYDSVASDVVLSDYFVQRITSSLEGDEYTTFKRCTP